MKQGLTILIIDDSQIIIDRLISLLAELQETGKMLFGLDFEEGKTKLETNKIDLLILDLNLGKKSGIDFLKFLKKNEYYCKVIIFTEESSQAKKDICLSLGADYFLNKFEDFDTLPDIIADIIGETTKIKFEN